MKIDSTTQFLGSELLPEENIPGKAKFHIIPCPMEETVSFGVGTRLGPGEILKASQELERNIGDISVCNDGIYTHPEINCDLSHQESLTELEKLVYEVAFEKKFPVIIGGEHSLTSASVKGVRRAIGEDIGIIQIDAHADLREDYQGNPHSHASVMRLLAELGFRIASLGVRAISTEEKLARKKFNVFSIDGERLVREQISFFELPDDFPKKLYLSLDFDGLDPSIIPSVGTPVPGGLSYYQVLDLIQASLEGRQIVGFDAVELSPSKYDLVSSFCAASLIQRIMHFV